MNKITALLVLISCCMTGFSQKAYFIYLQSEGAQPFFLKMNEQVYSSNSSGYLILSQLKDSTYNFSIGFPQNRWPEQVFSLSIAGKDKGFLLKNTADKSWALLDLQSEQRIDGQASVKQRSVKTEPREVSAFTEVLSKAANDPSLKTRVVPVAQPVVKKEEKTVTPALAPGIEDAPPAAIVQKPAVINPDSTLTRSTLPAPGATPVDSVSLVRAGKDTLIRKEIPELQAPPLTAAGKQAELDQVKPDSVKQQPVAALAPADTISQQPEQAAPAGKEETVPAEQLPVVYKPSVVKRRTESSTTEGFGITYIDEYPDGKKDTIQILIPNPKTVIRNVPPPQEDGQFLPMDSDAKDLTPAKKEPVNPAKNNCTNMASETDYLKLRKKMVATDGDDAMLAAAKKIFRTKCFTTEQIRNLGTLFLNDAGRYNFFDAAYLAVSDRDKFPGLQAELKDEYYISRFKAMLR